MDRFIPELAFLPRSCSSTLPMSTMGIWSSVQNSRSWRAQGLWESASSVNWSHETLVAARSGHEWCCHERLLQTASCLSVTTSDRRLRARSRSSRRSRAAVQSPLRHAKWHRVLADTTFVEGASIGLEARTGDSPPRQAKDCRGGR
ncbi:hypothetical protein D3C87_1183860 [compost metagenome]